MTSKEIIAGTVKAISLKTGGILIGENWFNHDKNSPAVELPKKGDKIELRLNQGGYYTGFSILQKETQEANTTSTSDRSTEIRRMNALTNAIAFVEVRKNSLELASITEEGIVGIALRFERYILQGK